MSIIHDALKKAQTEEKASGEHDGASVSGSALETRKPYTLIMVLAIVVGVMALGTLVWRFGPLLMAKKQSRNSNAPASTASAAMSSPRVTAPGVNPAESEAANLDQKVRNAERFLRIGDFAAAESIFRAVLASGEGNRAELANNLGLTLKRRGRLKEALGYYDQALEYEQNMAEVLNNRAVLFRKLKRYTDAESDLKSALKIKPGYPEALFNLGVVYEASGKKLAALEAYRKYLEDSSHEPGLVAPRIRQRISYVEAELAATEWKSRQR